MCTKGQKTNERRKKIKRSRSGGISYRHNEALLFFSRRQTWNNYFHIVVERKEIDVVIMTHTQHSMNIRFFFSPSSLFIRDDFKTTAEPPPRDRLFKIKRRPFFSVIPQEFS
jgi:hypothetical protein